MKKTFLILVLFLSLYGIASAATAGQLSYTPLEPFSVWDAKADAYNNFAYYINSIFKLLITLGSLFAVVMLVVAGIGYMVSEAAVDIEKAKQRARAALWGLLLLAGCWLVLYTINPDLLKFNLNIPTNAPSQYTGGSSAPGGSAPAAGSTFVSPLGTLTDQQSSDVRDALGCASYNKGLCTTSDRYAVVDPNNPNIAQATQNFDDQYCSAIFSQSVGLGYMKTLPGDIVGEPGKTLLVCSHWK